MNFIKNKLYILLLIAYAFPLGGIGFSGLTNIISYDGNDSDYGDARTMNLNYKDNGLEQGFNLFIYFDALPSNLAIEYSKEFKYQELTSTINFNGSEITNPSYAGRISDYFTVRKDLMDLSIPILAKVALSVGGGFNKHKYIVPSIALLYDMYNIPSGGGNLPDLFNAAEEDWDPNAVYDALADNAMDASGLHIQCGIQAKVLMLNAFITAKYTFITKDDHNSIDSFPGFTIGLAYGI